MVTDEQRSPRVVIASRLYEPEPSAASFRIAALARALAAKARVTVLTTSPPAGSDASRASLEGVRVRRAPVLRDRSGAIRGYLQYASFDVPLFFRLLVHRADVIVAEAPPTTGIVSLIAARLRRARFVYYPGDVWSDAVASMGAGGVLVRFMRWIESTVVRRADAVVAVSPEVGDRLHALGAARERVVLAGNGIDTEVFAPEVAAASEDRYFVYTGTMSEWQRPEIFVEGFALVARDEPDVTLRFFGQGAVEAELRELAARLVPDRVLFGGLVAPAESARWIRGAVAALVSIVPGVGYDFARPTKTYAAAAVGTPVLYTGAPTGADVVRDAGLGTVADFTSEAVAEQMRALLAEARSGATDRERPRRAAWAQENVSLSAVGARVAAVALAAAGGPRATR